MREEPLYVPVWSWANFTSYCTSHPIYCTDNNTRMSQEDVVAKNFVSCQDGTRSCQFSNQIGYTYIFYAIEVCEPTINTIIINLKLNLSAYYFFTPKTLDRFQ